MREVWNLDRLYAGFEDPAFARDLDTYEKTIDEFVRLADTLSAEQPLRDLKEAVRLLEQMALLGGKLSAYPRFRGAVNSGDNEATSWWPDSGHGQPHRRCQGRFPGMGRQAAEPDGAGPGG